MKKISFRIRREYYDQIVAGTKKVELRKNNEFWRKRIFVYNGGGIVGFADIAVFVCGKDVHRRKIFGAGFGRPEDFLGRELSPQGKEDVGKRCIAVFLGDECKED